MLAEQNSGHRCFIYAKPRRMIYFFAGKIQGYLSLRSLQIQVNTRLGQEIWRGRWRCISFHSECDCKHNGIIGSGSIWSRVIDEKRHQPHLISVTSRMTSHSHKCKIVFYITVTTAYNWDWVAYFCRTQNILFSLLTYNGETTWSGWPGTSWPGPRWLE